MKTLNLYNTFSQKKEKIKPVNGKYITLYTCGPTVYDFAHIGNFRTYVFEDLLKRTLKFLDFEVLHVMNITDIDDKTIKGAIKKNLSLKEYTKTFEKGFFEDIKTLDLDPADYYPRATEYIPEMVKIISDLLNKEIAYRGEDKSIYFSIKAFSSYGNLSHLNLEELEEGSSNKVSLDEYDKENASDFALWKAYDEKRDGSIFWESPFGKGRPGWHIECSSMAIKLLGETIDIHCGGVDNIFPHHENEIAQSESYTGKKFVEHWAHCYHLVVDGKKMSKSFNNFYTLRDILKKGYLPREVRFLLLKTHYRHKLNFTFEALEACKSSLKRLDDFILRLKNFKKEEKDFNLINPLIEKTFENFENGLIDDLNISKAISFLFDFVRDVNTILDEEKLSKKEAENCIKMVFEFDKVLKILKSEEEEIPEIVKKASQKREIARKEKNFKEADRLRDFLFSEGYIVEDTKEGIILKKR